MPDDPDNLLERLRRCATIGEELDLGRPDWLDQPSDAAPVDRLIPAEALRQLVIGADAINARAVRVRGAWIAGNLDLSFATVTSPLVMRECWLSASDDPHDVERGHLRLSNARLRSLVLSDCRLGDLELDKATIDGDVECDGSDLAGEFFGSLVRVAGSVWFRRSEASQATSRIATRMVLEGAKIAGWLDCSEARLDTVRLSGIDVGGSIDLAQAHVTGAVDLSHAEIGGSLNCDDARLERALLAEGMKVRGSVALGVTRAQGRIGLTGSRLDGDLSFSGGDFQGDVVANRLHVGNNIAFVDARAAKPVWLTLTEILGDLNCRGATFERDLYGIALNVGGSAIFVASDDHECRLLGTLELHGCAIRRDLFCRGVILDSPDAGLYAEAARIDGSLVWRPAAHARGQLWLERTSVTSLDDAEGSWPEPGDLHIDGFAYAAFGSDAPRTPQDRIAWLALQAPFQDQPYEHLINLYRERGQDADARAVGIARERARRTNGELGRLGWLRSVLLGATIRHGYGPGLALVWLLCIYLIGVVVFGHAGNAGAFDPVRAPRSAVVNPQQTGREPPSSVECAADADYPCFEEWAYAVDVVVPLLNLRQAEFWQPDATVDWGWWARLYGWIATPLGWMLATLTLGAFTGLVRRD